MKASARIMRISTRTRPAWLTESVTGQPVIHRETFLERQKKIGKLKRNKL